MRYSRKSTWPIGMEALERRTMMAADAMNNFLEPHDVNDDHMVAPLDALLIVNHLNDDQPHSDDRQLFRDVNDDHVVGPLDALLVVNVLNRRHGADDAGGGERGTLQEAWVSGLDGSRARVEFESEGAQDELSIRLVGGDANANYAVSLADIALGELHTDDRGRGQLKLDRGDNNGRPPIPPGLTGLAADMELVIGDLIDARLDVPSPTNPRNTTGGITGGDSLASISLTATLAPEGRLRRTAEYETDIRQGRPVRKFEVEIEGAEPHTSFTVAVDGVDITTLTTDAKGKSKLRWSSDPQDARETLLPASFPALAVGSQIRIGSSTAQFVPAVGDDG